MKKKVLKISKGEIFHVDNQLNLIHNIIADVTRFDKDQDDVECGILKENIKIVIMNWRKR